jgi:hypothetical protein
VDVTNLVPAIATELGELVAPLRVVAADRRPPHELVRLLRGTGWTLPGLAQVDPAGLFGALTDAADTVAVLPAAIRTGGLEELAASLGAVGDAVQAVRGLTGPFEELVGTVLGGSEHLAADLVEDVWQRLVVRWLARRAPTTFRVLRSVGIVANDPLVPLFTDAGVQVRSDARVLRLHPEAVPALVRDPIGTLRAMYVPENLGSGRDAQATALLVGSLVRPVVAGIGGQAHVLPPWGLLQELPAVEQDTAGRSIGVDLPLLSPEGSAFRPTVSVVAEVLSSEDQGVLGQRGPGVELSVHGLAPLHAIAGPLELDVAVAATAGVVFASPDRVVGEAGGTVDATATLARTFGTPLVLGADHGTRLELGVPTLRSRLLLDGDLDVEVELVLVDAAMVVSAGDGDSFLARVLPAVEMRVAGDVGLVWSRQRGLRLSGSSDLALRLPFDLDVLGVLLLEALQVTAEVTDTGFTLMLVIDGSFTLGPFTARVEGVGLRVLVHVDTSDGNLGLADLSLEFQPPYGFAFTILVGDTIVGGGFVRYDPGLQRYSGALSLEILAIGLGAIVVVDTQLPGDPDGWALFASLFLTFPSIPLGFGFFLSGVGGIVCLNRTMDALAIASGLREGAVDTILFPDDPVEDASAIISQLDAWFPLADGATVFGIAATITWGTPRTLITAQVGAMIVLPELQVAVMGSVAMSLPDEDDPVLSLHMDAIGTYDSADKTLMVVASLYDSTLLGTIDLSGDMAMYARFGADPYFLLSVGGYNPEFKPPAGLPAAVLDLRRMRAEVSLGEDVWYALEAYVAVTSNSFQFGAAATLEASAKFLTTTYTARGYVGFDVLLVFSPFSFSAGFTASVAITAGASDNELLAVSLAARLEGPQPWSATGTASFRFLGIDVSFEFAVGRSASVEAKPLQNVLDLVVEALEGLTAWSPSLPARSPVTLAGEDPSAAVTEVATVLRVRPDGDVVARQNLAPLERPRDVYGIHAIDGATRLDVDGAGITGMSASSHVPVTDWFAPAQYDAMTRSERLSAPSYEEMDAGVRISTGDVTWGDDVCSVIPDYEVKLITEEGAPARRHGRRGQLSVLSVLDAGALMDTGRLPASRTVTLPAAFAVTEVSWVVVDAETGRATGSSTSYRRALQRLGTRQAGEGRSVLAVVPAHAARTLG